MHLTLCTSLYALHSMHFTLCNSLYAIHSMHFTLCTSLYALHSMHFTLCTSLYALDSMHFTLCSSVYVVGSEGSARKNPSRCFREKSFNLDRTTPTFSQTNCLQGGLRSAMAAMRPKPSTSVTEEGRTLQASPFRGVTLAASPHICRRASTST